MALATRCPHCKTTFRVASDQLKLRGGIVRCGTCHQVFDGNATLVDLDAPAEPAAPPVPEIPAWLARQPAAPAAPVQDDAPIPAWLARAMDAEVKVEPQVEIAFEPIDFQRKRDAAQPDETAQAADQASEPDLLTDAMADTGQESGAEPFPPALDAPADDAAAALAWEPEPAASMPEAELADAVPDVAVDTLPTDAGSDLFIEDTSAAADIDPAMDDVPAGASADPSMAGAPADAGADLFLDGVPAGSDAAPFMDGARDGNDGAPSMDAIPRADMAPDMDAPAQSPADPVGEADAGADLAAPAAPALPPEQFALDIAPDGVAANEQAADAASAPGAAFPLRLPAGYVLDYDLSDPAGYIERPAAASPPPPPLSPLRKPAPVYEPGPDTELGPLYETDSETHYDLDIVAPALDKLELSVTDEVEFSSADAHSQLPPPAAAEPALPAADEEPDVAAPAADVLPDLESGPLPLLRASAASEDALADLAEPAPAPVAAHATERDADADEPEFVRLAREKELASRRRTMLLGVGTAILAIALLVQGVTTFRNILAAKYPGVKPVLTSACALFNCKVELPAQLDALKIEAPELQSLGNNTFVLTTLLRNESGLAQTWPYIHLELTDANDKALVRRVFTPAQYLPPGTVSAKGFGATSEQPVKIHFELKQLKASGFHVAVFYP